MKITKNPNQKLKCPKCNAEMEVEAADIASDNTGMYPACFVNCPHCTRVIDARAAAKILGVPE